MSKILLQVIDVDRPNDDPLFMEPRELNVLLGSEGGERYTDLRVLQTVMIEEDSKPIDSIAGFVGNSVRYEILYHVPIKTEYGKQTLTWREFTDTMNNSWNHNGNVFIDENGLIGNDIFKPSNNYQRTNKSFVNKIDTFLKKFAQRIFM